LPERLIEGATSQASATRENPGSGGVSPYRRRTPGAHLPIIWRGALASTFFTGGYGGSVEYESGELAAKLGSNLVVEESSVMKDSPQSPSFIVAPLANPQSMN
jgi:hypothetical protein